MKDITLPHNGKCPTAFIVICLDKNISESVSAFQKDVGIAAQTILLSAVEMELGGCMIGSFDAEKIGVLLKFDENIVPLLVVAVGKPDDKIVLQEVSDGESIKYSRDENDIHYVPKRKLKDILLNTKGVE